MTRRADLLPLDQLVQGPGLSGPAPRDARLSSDGRYCAWLQPTTTNAMVLELWVANCDRGDPWRPLEHIQAEPDAPLSDAERDHRERLRVFSAGIVSFDWRPHAHELLVPVGNQMLLCQLRGDGQPAQCRDLAPQHTLSHLSWAPDGHRLAAVCERNLVVFEVAGDRECWITRDGGGTISHGLPEFIAQEEMHRFEGFWWSPDSTALAWVRVDESPVPVSHRYDVEADEIRLVSQRYPYAGGPNVDIELWIANADGSESIRTALHLDDGYLARVGWTPDSTALAVQVQNRLQNRLSVERIGRADGQVTAWFEEESATWINLVDGPIWPTGDSDPSAEALWISGADDLDQLHAISPDGTRRVLTDGERMVNRVHRADATHVWFDGWSQDPRECHLYRLHRSSGVIEQLTDPGGTNECSLAGDRLAVIRSSISEPPMLTVRGLHGGNQRLLRSNDPAAPGHPLGPYHAALADSQWVSLPAADGQQLYGCLWRGRDFDPGQRWPVLVCVYGGPGVQRVRNHWRLDWRHFLTQRGWLVFELDNRGSGNRGRRFEAPLHHSLGTAEVADQLAGVAWLTRQPWIDPDRIGVYGHSYGGYMTLQCLAQAPDVFRAGIAVAPVSTWNLYDTHYTERYMGLPGEQGPAYLASDALHQIDDLRGDLLLIHGMADDNVLFTHTTRIIKALQDRNQRFELMTYPGSKHALAEPSVALHRYTAMTEFLHRTLPPGGT